MELKRSPALKTSSWWRYRNEWPLRILFLSGHSSFIATPLRARSRYQVCCGVAYIVWGREATVAVDELLLGAEGGVMGLGRALHQLEPIAELAMQGRRAVPHRFQAAAPPWSVSGEGGDDDVSVWLHGVAHGTDVPLAILSTGQEVEHGAGVPDIVGVAGQVGSGDVRLQPGDLGGVGADALLSVQPLGPGR